jgi:hypothetical protein
MAHVITSTQDGTGPGGSAKSSVEYAPAHSVPPAEQIRKIKKAGRVLERLNDYLYADGADPYPDDHD